MKTSEEELQLDISKKNSILILNKLTFLKFYNNFYQLFENKNKDIEIFLENKLLDSKNAFLLTLTDQTEILENMNFKKGTLFYEYIVTQINSSETLDNDIIFYDLINILKNIQRSLKMNIDYDMNEDLEKLILSQVEFNLKVNFENINEIINLLLKNYLEKNISKTGIIFYDSSLISININSYESCYFFDINSKKRIEEYNEIVDKEVKEFDLEFIINKLESIWPVDFNRDETMLYIELYWKSKLINLSLEVLNETSLLTYKLLDKMYNKESKIIIKNFQIRDNVKSFLEQI
mgnify:FL=1